MSESPEPVKPKVGSLRDRIAAFESKPAAPAAPAPAPGPRPARTWKPKPVDPPAVPSTGNTSPTPTERKVSYQSGMSASDARDSIQRAGGSLKERMAALQGKGAFGQPGGAAPPPVAPKPREWKKPVVAVPQPEPVEDHAQSPATDESTKSPISPAAAASPASEGTAVEHPLTDEAISADHVAPVLHDETDKEPAEHVASPPAAPVAGETQAEGEGDTPEKSEEEIEAERRAAIAARMARLGGARLGMGVPMFGAPKPKPKPKPTVHEAEPETDAEKAVEEIKQERIAVLPVLPKVAYPPVPAEKDENTDASPVAEKSEDAAETAPPAAIAEADEVDTSGEGPIVSPVEKPAQELSPVGSTDESSVAATAAPSAPTPQSKPHMTMPLPAAPRRTGPPRRQRPALPPAEEEEKPALAEDVAVKEAEGLKEDLSAAKDVEGPQLGPSEVELEKEDDQIVRTEVPKESSPTSAVKESELAPSVPLTTVEAAHDDLVVEDVEGVKHDLNSAAEVEKPDLGPSVPAEALVEGGTTHEVLDATAGEEITEQLPEEDKVVDEETAAEEPPLVHEEDASKELISIAPPSGPEETASESAVAEVIAPGPDSSVPPGGFSVDAKPTNESGLQEDELVHSPEKEAQNAGEDQDEDEDEEAARRKRVAERMKKLGSVSFGMPMPSFPGAAKERTSSSAEKSSPITSSFVESAAPVQSIIAEPLHQEPGQMEGHEAEEPVAGDEVELDNEGFLSTGHRDGDLPEHALEHHAEDIDEKEAEIGAELPEKTATPTRSLPPPPPPRRTGPISEDRSAGVGLESEEASAEHPVDQHQRDDTPDDVLEYHEDDAESHTKAVEETTSPVSPTPRRSLPPPPPAPSAPSAGDSDVEVEEHPEETEETEEEGPKLTEEEEMKDDGVEIEVTHTEDEQLPALPTGVSQTIVQKSLTEEETSTGEGTEPPVIALVNTQALAYDDDEPDPIDPSFYSPPSRQPSSSGSIPRGLPEASPLMTSGATLAGDSPPSRPAPILASDPQVSEFEEEDEEQSRRQTIAARMAKLGGLRFGLPPSMPLRRVEPPVLPEPETVDGDAPSAAGQGSSDVKDELVEPESATEESEYVRRQAILARLVAGGGRGFGMAPHTAPLAPPPAMQRTVTEDMISEKANAAVTQETNDGVTADADEEEQAPPPPPRPQRVVPPPQRQATGGSVGSSIGSIPAPPPSRRLPSIQTTPAPKEPEDDGEEEEDLADSQNAAEEDEEDEMIQAPPPPSARTVLPPLPQADVPPPLPAGRRSSSSVPAGRPPVPQAPAPPLPPTRDLPRPQRGSSGHTGFSSVNEGIGSGGSSLKSPVSNRDYPRERTVSPPKTFASPTDTSLSQWELPEIPSASLGFGETTVASISSWSEDDSMYADVAEPAAPPPPPKPVRLPDLDGDQLMTLWGSVGTRVLQAASQLQEHSKRAVIGDGSGDGFVLAALDLVPSAMKPLAPHVYGHLIFAMSGQSLQRRASDIMEGDVVVITDAEFKGRKGLVPYHQHVGSASDPLIGVVHEFEPKNSKLKVLTASQHPNHYPTIEAVSYRLDDMKQGSFRVYRVAQA